MDEQSHFQSTVTPKPGLFDGASPKLTFIMGLVCGVALVSVVGWALASGFNLSAGRTMGARPGSASPAASATNPPAQAANNPAPPAKAKIVLRDGDYTRGDPQALVTLVEYSDLECPFCKRFHPSMQQLLRDYPGKVRWVYRHFPLSFHANAEKEAEAAECIGKLGGNDKFWSYVDKIYERTTSNGTGFALADLPKLAGEVGVSSAKFTSCLDSGEFTTKVQQDIQEGTSFGVGGTPTTFVNGQAVEGAVPYEQLKAVVEQVLSKR